jgi:hypothetical protein
VCDSWLYGTVCRQRVEMLVRVGYMELCVDKELKCWDKLLYGAVCRQKVELCVTVG